MFARFRLFTLVCVVAISCAGCGGSSSEVSQAELDSKPELQPDAQLDSARRSLKSSQKRQRGFALAILQTLGDKAKPALPDLDEMQKVETDPDLKAAIQKTIDVINGNAPAP